MNLATAILAQIPQRRPTPRLHGIDVARGIAIILVVIGHVVATGPVPAGIDWYLALLRLVYQFHMHLFMVLLGITFSLSLPSPLTPQNAISYSFRRVPPLLLAFLLMGTLVVCGKLLAAEFIHVDNRPGSILSGLATVLFLPTHSAAKFLWFLYVASLYLSLFPLVFSYLGARPILFLIISIPISLIPFPEYFALARAAEYLPFFALGMVLWMKRTIWESPAPVLLATLTIGFAVLLILSLTLSIPRWATGAASIIPILAFACKLHPPFQGVLAHLGTQTLSIYLLHGLFMGLLKGLLRPILPWDGPNFIIYFILLTISGITLPLAAKSSIQRIRKHLYPSTPQR